MLGIWVFGLVVVVDLLRCMHDRVCGCCWFGVVYLLCWVFIGDCVVELVGWIMVTSQVCCGWAGGCCYVVARLCPCGGFVALVGVVWRVLI